MRMFPHTHTLRSSCASYTIPPAWRNNVAACIHFTIHSRSIHDHLTHGRIYSHQVHGDHVSLDGFCVESLPIDLAIVTYVSVPHGLTAKRSAL